MMWFSIVAYPFALFFSNSRTTVVDTVNVFAFLLSKFTSNSFNKTKDIDISPLKINLIHLMIFVYLIMSKNAERV